MRQVRLLEDRATLTVAGYGKAPAAACEFIAVPHKRTTVVNKVVWALTLLLARFERYYWNRPEVQAAQWLLDGREFDLVIANDNSTLPLALKLAKGKPVLADAHEYSPREFDDMLLWWLLFSPYQDYLCRTYLPRAAAMSTVCQGIADAYRANYAVDPTVVMNMPAYQALRPSSIEIGKVRMIHHGVAIRSRQIEVMIDVMAHLDPRFSFDFMLVESDIAYMRDLQARAAPNPRIRFVPPVRMEDICVHINQYDVGIYLLPPVNFNQKHALPNKFFEFIQARLAVAVGPSPEMARIVDEYGLGVVATSFEPAELARELTRLVEKGLSVYKQASHKAAFELSYERSSQTMWDQINWLLGTSISNE
jgi:hypothetical protein